MNIKDNKVIKDINDILYMNNIKYIKCVTHIKDEDLSRILDIWSIIRITIITYIINDFKDLIVSRIARVANILWMSRTGL